MKKAIGFFLSMVMVFSLGVPAFAEMGDNRGETQPWAGEDETWYLLGDIMLLENSNDYCPKGEAHYPPDGYKFSHYSSGRATGNYDGFAKILTIISAASGNPIIIKVTSLGAALFELFDKLENPNIYYYEYVYTQEGKAPFIHTLYILEDEDGIGHYLSCETYFQI